MCHIICSEPNSPTFGWGIPHYFFSQSGLQNPHNGENSPLLDTLPTEIAENLMAGLTSKLSDFPRGGSPIIQLTYQFLKRIIHLAQPISTEYSHF